MASATVVDGTVRIQPPAREVAVECDSLRRVYRSGKAETVALDGLSLRIEAGTVFGLLGPNGAGKTTTVRLLATLLAPSGGRASVAGFDVVREAGRVRREIGLAIGGEKGFYGRITGRQNLHYFGALAGMRPGEARRRAGEVLDLVRLSERADEKVERYSRGMKQRLHLARALMTRPRVLFLDEPTLGLDAAIAQEFRALIPTLAADGATVLLTTHYMLEADALCSRLAVIDRGRLVAEGTPEHLKRGFGAGSVVEATVRTTPPGLLEAARALPGVEHAEVGSEGGFPRLRLYAHVGADVKAQVEALCGAGNCDGLVVRGRTLEEAYLALLRIR